MNTGYLFAIDKQTDEVIISESSKGSNKVHLIERMGRKDNEVLYHAVAALTGIAQAEDFDAALFKAMDKVCQMIYNKLKERK